MSGDHNAHQKQMSYLDDTAMLLRNAIKTIKADERLIRQAWDALRQCEYTSAPAQRPMIKRAIAALRERLGEME